MPRKAYIVKNFREETMLMIAHAVKIIDEYAEQGFDLTLRQLYYQFVSRDLLPNSQKSYNKLGTVISDARLAGYIDWDRIVDRARHFRQNSHWDNPGDIVNACATSYAIDKWEDQEYRPEVWIEKEALEGVIAGICGELDITYFACKGYTSQSMMWRAAQRLLMHKRNGQIPFIVHLGDHDPSGIDMTRDIVDRLALFMGGTELKRLALNMDQVEKYDPPPNPAKLSDTRADAYVMEFGDESWELDALEPSVISDLIEKTVKGIRDDNLWDAKVEQEEDEKEKLKNIAANWDEIIEEHG